MEKGIKNRIELVVEEKLTAKQMKSGTLDVFATPAMIALIEETAWRSIAPCLEEGQGTVGTLLLFVLLLPASAPLLPFVLPVLLFVLLP